MKRPFKPHPKQRKIVQVLTILCVCGGGSDGGRVVGGQQLLRALTIPQKTPMGGGESLPGLQGKEEVV